MAAPSQLPGVIGDPGFSPARLPLTAERGAGGGAYKAVELTDGVYIAFGDPAMTDEPRWINITESGTWPSS